MNEQPSLTKRYWNGSSIGAEESNSLSMEQFKASLKQMAMDDKPRHALASSSSASATENSVLSVDEELHQAALMAFRRAREEKARQDAIPVHVKLAMLNEEFTNVRDIGGEITEGMPCGFSAHEDQAFELQQSVDYSDCVRTLSDLEIRELQSSLQNSEKQRFDSLVRSLSDQLAEFHQLLDEHERAKSEIIKLRKVCEARIRQDKEKEHRMNDLEQDVIEMKLSVAQYKSNEDYQRLTIARLEMENKQLKSELEKKSPQEGGDDSGSLKGHQRKHSELTQSLKSKISERNIRAGVAPPRKNNLLTQSYGWMTSASGWNTNLASEKNEPMQVRGRPERTKMRRESTPDVPTTNTTWRWSITPRRMQCNNSDPIVNKRHPRSQSVTVPSQHAKTTLVRASSDCIPRATMDISPNIQWGDEKDSKPDLEETRRTFQQRVKAATQKSNSNCNTTFFKSASARQCGALESTRTNDSWEVQEEPNLSELKRSNPNCAPQGQGMPYVSSGGSLSSITFDAEFFLQPTKEMQKEFRPRQLGQECPQLRRGNSAESGLSLSYC